MAITIAPRPTSISGCMQTWSEEALPNTIRSETDDLTVKVRRRTTGLVTNIDCQVTLEASKFDDFMLWFKVNQLGGSIPTRIRRPQDGKEIVARMRTPPKVEWVDKKAFTATLAFEMMPGWELL